MDYVAEIALEELEFFAHHGYYEQERLKGNTFTVDVKVSLPFNDSNTEDIHTTVNYEGLYKIVAAVMAEPVLLLETVAATVIEQLFIHYPQLTQAEVSVAKHKPPIEGACARSKITLKRSR